MNFCGNCGNKLADGGSYCLSCGARAQTLKKPSNDYKVALIIVSSVLCSGFLIVLITVLSFIAMAASGAGHKKQSAYAGPDSEMSSCGQNGQSLIPAPAGKPQFIYFYSDTCPSCQQQRPVIDELQQSYAGKIEFIQIDADTPEGGCEFEQQGFEYVPAMIFIDSEGYEFDASEGFVSKNELQLEFEELLGNMGRGQVI